MSVRSPLRNPGKLTPISSPSKLGDIPPANITISASFTFATVFLMLTSSLNPRSKFNCASPLKYWKRISISYGLPASACMA